MSLVVKGLLGLLWLDGCVFVWVCDRVGVCVLQDDGEAVVWEWSGRGGWKRCGWSGFLWNVGREKDNCLSCVITSL